MGALAGTASAAPGWNLRSPLSSNDLTKGNAMKQILAIAVLGMSVLTLSACNTVEGAGKDVKATGQAVENAAKDAKPK